MSTRGQENDIELSRVHYIILELYQHLQLIIQYLFVMELLTMFSVKRYPE